MTSTVTMRITWKTVTILASAPYSMATIMVGESPAGQQLRIHLRGIVLSIVILLINLLFMYLLADKIILKRPGWFGAGLAATTGVACVDPSLMAAGNEAYQHYIPEAVSLLALTFLITTLICAVLCRIISEQSKHKTGQPL